MLADQTKEKRIMRTSKVLIAVISLVALCGAVSASELVIDLQVAPAQLDEAYVGDVVVEIWATAIGTGGSTPDWEHGMFATGFDLISGNTLAEILTSKGAPVVTWESNVGSDFNAFKPAVVDLNADGALDTQNMSFADAGGSWNNLALAWSADGTGSRTLIATQTWIKSAPGALAIGINVDPLSRHYDWLDPQFPGSWSTQFDVVTGIPIGGTGPDDDDDTTTTDPNADEVIPPAMGAGDRGAWQGPTVWGDPDRWLELTAGEEIPPPGEPIDEYEWDFTKDGAPLIKTGQTITVYLGELMAAGWELATWDDVNKEFVGGLVNYKLRLMQGSSTSEAGSTLFIPEPATLTLIGFGALALIRRRRS